MASNCDDSAMRSWKDLVKVNGSFYCNLSLKGADAELAPSPPPTPPPPPSTHSENGAFHHQSADWIETGQESIYVNSQSNPSVHLLGGPNRTILRIGEKGTRQPSTVDLTDANSSEATCHTIKLVIGEPLSLDTSEYVSWDGSQTGPQSGASGVDDDEDIGDDDSDEDSCSDEAHLDQHDSLEPVSSMPLQPHTVDDELTHSCCRFFDERQQKLSSIVSTPWNRSSVGPEAVVSATSSSSSAGATTKSTVPGLHAKMEHLRREIVSLLLSIVAQSFCKSGLLRTPFVDKSSDLFSESEQDVASKRIKPFFFLFDCTKQQQQLGSLVC